MEDFVWIIPEQEEWCLVLIPIKSQIDLWELVAHRICILLVVLRRAMTVQGGRPLDRIGFLWPSVGARNDSLIQLYEFLNGLTFSLSSIWHIAVNEFLGPERSTGEGKVEIYMGNGPGFSELVE